MHAIIINGEVTFNPRMYHKTHFEQHLVSQGIIVQLPFTIDGVYDASNTVHIVPATILPLPSYNPRIQYLSDVEWHILVDRVEGHVNVLDRDLADAKKEMKQILASNRYSKECTPIQHVVQGQTVTIETIRDDRHIWFQSLMLLGENEVQPFKFPVEQIWIVLTKSDIQSIVAAIRSHVQSCFNQEAIIAAQIDAASTLSDLITINISME